MMKGNYTAMVLIVLGVAGCTNFPPSDPDRQANVEERSSASESPTVTGMSQAEKARVVKVLDLLDRADLAFKAKRLTSPRGDNALAYYQQVLQLLPDYQEAKQGIDRIADRYLHWAEGAIAEGRIDSARRYLAKARRLRPDSPELSVLLKRLRHATSVASQADSKSKPAAASNESVAPSAILKVSSTDNRYIKLEPKALKARSSALKLALGELADRIQHEQARVIIEAPSDPQGRWIYQQLNQRHEDYRIRANLRLASKPGIRLLPR